ncbi:MAG: hypothetical protein ACREUZ_02845 [Burkholderiales bacterium]
MHRRARVLMVVSVFAASSVGFGGSAGQAQEPQASDAQNMAVGEAGFFRYAGGPAKAKFAVTQTTATTIAEGGWMGLPGAVLQYTVPAGAADLFNVAFSAECRLFGAGANDYLRIRVIDTVTVGGAFVSRSFLEPHDGFQAFCSADGYATHKGNWVERAGPGRHTLVVQFQINDAAPDNALSAWIDDWTFELVVYD